MPKWHDGSADRCRPAQLQHSISSIRRFTRSPDVTKQFSADLLLARLQVSQQAFRGRNHSYPQTAAHARDFRRADVPAQARRAYPAQPLDDALLALVLQLQLDRPGKLAFDGEIGDVAFPFEDARDALLDPRVGHFDGGEQRAVGVADPGQHVGNRIVHRFTNWPWSRPGSN